MADKTSDDSSKLKTLLSILRKFIGVADIASVRFSLPAQLLEPTPNLEYWNYLDRPETFISIGDSDDPLGRMLAVLRFWFTKDLCNWEIEDAAPPILGVTTKAPQAKAESTSNKAVRLSYLTEQTSHHPPVSAFYIDCPAKGVSARGFDQLSAKFTGTSVRVTAGAHNLGIFVTVESRGNEEYQLTHPTAQLGGLLRGSPSVTITDSCYITCQQTRIKVILHYLEEGWLSKSQNKVLGVIYRYDHENDRRTRIKDVPEQDVLAKLEGCWQRQVYFTLAGSSEPHLLVDLDPLFPAPKIVPPESEQLSNESRRFWHGVTEAILEKRFAEATKLKQELEERQRERAAGRKTQNEDWKPRFFTGALTPLGKPELTEDGKEALRGLHEGNYRLQESISIGA
ncbi:hypothetical protein MMC16_006067 [Acarospora aff. strigata]|nr:hypothetical protein [Acarospora aff. strigata]